MFSKPFTVTNILVRCRMLLAFNHHRCKMVSILQASVRGLHFLLAQCLNSTCQLYFHSTHVRVLENAREEEAEQQATEQKMMQ